MAGCPQSARYQTVQKEELLDIEDIVAKAKIKQERGAGRFCMGAARGPNRKILKKFPQYKA